jgi:hypothetical protein
MINIFLKILISERGMVVMPIVPILGRLRQEVFKFQTSLGYIARPCLKKKSDF